MATTKRLTDLTQYSGVLPYASELFGIYQPLLGWKSKRTAARYQKGFQNDKRDILDRLKQQFTGIVSVKYDQDCRVTIALQPGQLVAGRVRSFDSVLLEHIAQKLPPYDQLKADTWATIVTRQLVDEVLQKVVIPAYVELYTEQCREQFAARPMILAKAHVDAEMQRRTFQDAIESRLRHESALAGAVLFLTDHKRHDELKDIFFSVKNNDELAMQLEALLASYNAEEAYLNINTLNPADQEHLKRVALSPISVVHLFRQYFFELDTFLGTPVSHVWLSPGSTVELIEVHTRRTLVEKTLETFMETTVKTESEQTTKEEISEAVKEDNKQDIQFGASVTASYASVTATSNFDYSTSQQTAREETHKRMRQQTDKLSTEIRKNYRSTFRTVTETTDTSSKRYVLTNTTNDLVNYELRRKMRQVAVQVQDIGTYLCWQTYVDRPGETLGLGKLIHIAKPAELDALHAPDEIPMLQPFTEEKVISVPFISAEGTGADNEDEVYKDGVEVDDSEWFGELEKIQADFPIECVCSKGNFVLTNVEFDSQGKPIAVSRRGEIAQVDDRATFTLHLDSADFQGQNSVQVKLTLHWSPAEGANEEAIKKNKANVAAFKAKEAAAYQKAYEDNCKQRIKLIHQISPRPAEDLREEERIVIYRKLIQELLTNGITMPDDRTRHVVAELINSIFDVDKMLYFVAPEWWRPRLRLFEQQLTASRPYSPGYHGEVGAASKGVLGTLIGYSASLSQNTLVGSTVGWGGTDDPTRDNYFITEDSEPARFGSSLGWLLQLDGDSMRNAFLNAPWVKAVIPIRPGKEEAAVNWLKGVEGLNGIGNGDIYRTSNPNEKDINGKPLDGQKLLDVIMDLAKKVQAKHKDALKKGQFPTQDEIADPSLVDEDNVVTAVPIDRVYEHGFYPLQDGFRANVQAHYEVFDQWLEILPTDQVVPVAVEYDPKTGRQL